MNILVLSGRLGKDGATVREHNGRTFLTFSLAEDTGWNDGNGNWQSRTRWHDCVIWGGSARMAEYMVQGRPVTLYCELDYSEYKSASGEQHKRARIKLDLSRGHRVEFGQLAPHPAQSHPSVNAGDALPSEDLSDPAPPAGPVAGKANGKAKRGAERMF